MRCNNPVWVHAFEDLLQMQKKIKAEDLSDASFRSALHCYTPAIGCLLPKPSSRRRKSSLRPLMPSLAGLRSCTGPSWPTLASAEPLAWPAVLPCGCAPMDNVMHI